MRLPHRHSRRARVSASDLWRRLRTAVAVLLVVLTTGTVGYRLIGLSTLDALYQTVVTVSTVGYREVGVVDDRYQGMISGFRIRRAVGMIVSAPADSAVSEPGSVPATWKSG